MARQFFGSLDEIINQEKEKREEARLVHILELIQEVDEGIIAVIEEDIFNPPKYGKVSSEQTSVRDFSTFLTPEEKEGLKQILLLHKPELIRQLQERGFSFSGEYVGA